MDLDVSPSLLRWLLDTDPALRWQVQRDLAGESEKVWRATRATVATTGFGAELLSHQDLDGQWAGGAFFPGDFSFEEANSPHSPDAGGQPSTATTWSLTTLREWGVDAAALAVTADKLRRNSRWEYDDLPYWDGEVDVCINGYTLANGAWLGVDMSALAQWFVEHRLADGGWNCEWVEGSTRSSVASTLNGLKGVLSYEQSTGGTAELTAARLGAQEYLLQRRLLYQLSTGEPLGEWTNRFAYPFRWHYSALNALDHFRSAALHDGVGPDPRLAEAVEVVSAARNPDGTWTQQRRHPGRVWFDIDVPPGEPSPWLTFLALRVLRWWEGAR